MKIVGHRGGAAGKLPENSMPALKKALAGSLQAVEIDLRLTKDKKLVVHHDRAILLQNGDRYKISQLTYERLKRLLPGMITIDEAAEIILARSHAELILDCKGRGWAKTLAAKLNQWQRQGFDTNRVIVLSFYHQELARLKKLFPAARMYFLFRYLLFLHLVISKFVGAEGAGYNWRYSVRPLVWFCHLHGLKIYYYTVNDPKQAKKYSRYGVDYLATDYPKEIFGAVNR